MNGLTARRAQLADSLALVGVPVVSYVPATITPPLIVISTGDPYVAESDTFDEHEMKVALELYLIVGTGTNDAEVEKLDALITATILELVSDWLITGCSAPYMGTANDRQYLTCRLAVSSEFTLKGTP